MTFAEIRKEKRFTQEALAEKIGVSQSAIAAWETGVAVPTVKNLMLASKVLDVDVSTLANAIECTNKKTE